MKIKYTCKSTYWIKKIRDIVEEKGEANIIFSPSEFPNIELMNIIHTSSGVLVDKEFITDIQKHYYNASFCIKFKVDKNKYGWYSFDKFEDIDKNPDFWQNPIQFKDL